MTRHKLVMEWECDICGEIYKEEINIAQGDDSPKIPLVPRGWIFTYERKDICPKYERKDICPKHEVITAFKGGERVI